MFDAKIGVAAKHSDDLKLRIWVNEAFTYFQKLTMSGGHLSVWDDFALCEKFKDELATIFAGLISQSADEISVASVDQMHMYFSERLKIMYAAQ